MDWFLLVSLGAVALVLVTGGVLAARHPVLLRMGLRNALRRPTQTTVVVLGLMVGTAIISGSLAAGDSLKHGIRKGAYDALGPADAFVQIEGQLHFPSVLYDDLSSNATVRQSVAAMAPLLYEEAALANDRTRQSEPRVSILGIDPEATRPFGGFHGVDGRSMDGSDLGADGLYVTERLAADLGLRVGDAVRVNYAESPAPRVPRVEMHNGTLTASAGACPLPPVCDYAAPPTDPATFEVQVEPGAVGITTLVFWFGPNAERVDLDQILRAPDGGAAFVESNGTSVAPENPSVLNVTPSAGTLAPGAWTWEVRSKAAVSQPFRAVSLVFYEEYNLTALQEFAAQAEAAGFSHEDFLPESAFETRSRELTVRAIVTSEGFGDFLLGQNVFALQETVAHMYGVEDKINMILVSGDLDPERGPARVGEILDVLPRAVNASAAAHPEAPALESVKVVSIKPQWLDAADRAGKLFTEFLATVGGFTIVAGIMLIVNIFVMLAEERKSELGMARAVGLKRRQLIYLFGFEGLAYALAASVIGVGLGIALAWGLIYGLNDAISVGNQESGILNIPFHVAALSPVHAFAAGFLITMATVAIASWRVSRLNVVRAIRRIEDPPRRAGVRVLWLGAALLALGLAWSAYGLVSEHFVSRVLGPCVALFGAGLVAARWLPRRVAYPLAGAGVASYALWSIFNLGNPDGLMNRLMGPVRGVIIVLAVVLILVHLPQLARGTAALLLRVRALVPAVRPGIAYPLEKKTRTGLTITMFALVILVVVAFSIFGATFVPDVKQQSGGYDVEGDATVPIGDLRAWLAEHGDPTQPDPFRDVERFDELRYAVAFGGRILRVEGERVEYQGPPVDYVYAYDEAFARNNRFGFESLDPAYASAEEAYLAVLRDPTLVILSIAYNFDEHGAPGRFQVGDTLTIETRGGTSAFRIIGFQQQFYLGGVWVHPSVLEANFQRIRGEYLFNLQPGADARATAMEIEAAFQDAGMDAEALDDVVAERLEQNRRFLTLFQLFLVFGLVVGVASLGIITARTVLERRQEIGMLRAIGYSRRDVLRMFYVEIFFTTTLGVIVGSAIGVLTSYGVVASTPSLSALGVEFRIPWWDIAQILALVYVAVFLATYVPARRGSRTPPAEAVRYIE